jgi:putative transposase
MPPRLERRQQTGDLHFVTFSCHGRNPYLALPDSKRVFQTVLEKTRKRYKFDVVGYVIMPEHVHLLMTEPPVKPLSVALAVIKRTVSAELPEKPFWLPRYFDFNVFSYEKRVEKLRYIHRNPVHRGLCEKPEDYEWSSFRVYGLNEVNPVMITKAI